MTAGLALVAVAARQHGFILIAISLRHYAALPMPDANRPESWALEVVRRQLEQHNFTTRDAGLVEAILKAGHIAIALDGTNGERAQAADAAREFGKWWAETHEVPVFLYDDADPPLTKP